MFLIVCVCVSQALVTTELEGGDRQRAMKRLRVPPLGAAQVSLSRIVIYIYIYNYIYIVIYI